MTLPLFTNGTPEPTAGVDPDVYLAHWYADLAASMADEMAEDYRKNPKPSGYHAEFVADCYGVADDARRMAMVLWCACDRRLALDRIIGMVEPLGDYVAGSLAGGAS